MKLCQKCKEEKPDCEFTNKRSRCKSCTKQYNKEYRLKNKEKYKQYKQTDEYKQKSKEYKQNTKEHIKKWSKDYYLNNKERIQQYYKLNKETIIERNKKWYTINKDILNSKFKIRYALDPKIKLRRLISNRINEWLHKIGTTKNGNSIIKYLPYNMIELQKHIETKFEPWMTWENHGRYNSKVWNDNDQSTWTWQIDHIIPQSKLPYKSMEDDNFKKCWALDNLRPLSSKQNFLDSVNRIRHIK